MAKRDNAPYKRKTKRRLLGDVNELVDKYGGVRQAYAHELDLLQKRIRDVEEEYGVRVDIEQLPEKAKNYLMYGVIPDRSLRKYIDDAKRLRKSDLLNLASEDKFWYDDDDDIPLRRPIPEPAPISKVELNTIRGMLEESNNKDMASQLLSSLDSAITSLGEDDVAMNIADNYRDAVDIANKALQYKPSASRGSFWIQSFKFIITGTRLTFEELQNINDFNELNEGQDYLPSFPDYDEDEDEEE